MLKHYIDLISGCYIIEQDGVIVFSIELKDKDNIQIRTPKDVYEGQIENIAFLK